MGVLFRGGKKLEGGVKLEGVLLAGGITGGGTTEGGTTGVLFAGVLSLLGLKQSKLLT